jgi:hypothetical protein
MPYGIEMSGDIYCQYKHDVYSSDGGDTLLWHYMWSYVDDDAVATNSVINHIFILMCVFERLLTFGLTLRIPKCIWLVDELKYGGLIVGHNTVRPNPLKSLVISKIKTPQNVKQLRGFMGMTQWQFRNFSSEYPRWAAMITRAYRKPNDRRPFATVWKENKLDVPFEKIKALSSRRLVNTTFNPDAADTTLWFDWSEEAMCAVLTQEGKIVRVEGRACSVAESRYKATKGEACAYQFAQLKFRHYLLSCEKFTAVTDHWPLLGIENHFDLEEHDDMMTVWRERTEQFRSRRTLVWVRGERNLADYWTRFFPWSELPDVAVSSANAMASSAPPPKLTIADGDFKPDEMDTEDLKLPKRYGMPHEIKSNHVRVFKNNDWRTYVPVRSRPALLAYYHFPMHPGSTKMKSLLSQYYFPRKKKLLTKFLRSCVCNTAKSSGNPRRESKLSKINSRITAEHPYHIVQVDVHDYMTMYII